MSSHYTGEVDLQLRRHGQGEYHYPAKVFKFNGRWKDGLKQGEGTFSIEGGTTFDGSFVNGEIEGSGTKSWPDGRRYEGHFSKGEADGHGTFSSPMGECYVGTWTANKRHGYGNLTLSSGQGTYTGGFKNHRFNGVGQLKLATGFQYTGEFSSGQPHGHGEAMYPDCSTFRGPFEAGLRHGSGGFYVCGVTGIKFSGEWISDKVALQPSALSIETEKKRKESSCAENEDDVSKRDADLRAGARAKKVHEKIKSTKKQSAAEEPPAAVLNEIPLITIYDSDGHVEPLWCRCMRQSQPVAISDTPHETLGASPQAEGGAESEDEQRVPAIPRREVAVEESGRKLKVTLHQAVGGPSLTTESSSWPGDLSDPIEFSVSPPTGTDVSQDIERFPTEGLLALFNQDRQVYPKDSDGRLAIVPAPTTETTEEASYPEPDPCIEDQHSGAGDKHGPQQTLEAPAVEEKDALESERKTVRDEVDSTRCLLLGAGEGISLRTPRLATCAGQPDGVSAWAPGEFPPQPHHLHHEDEEGGTDSETTPQRAELGARGKDEYCNPSCLTLCLDFRLALDAEALSELKVSCSGAWSDSNARLKNSPEQNVTVLSYGEVLEVWAVVHQSADDSVSATRRGYQEDITPCDSSELLPEAIADDASAGRHAPISCDDALCSGHWFIRAISVRVGSCVTELPCAKAADSRNQGETVRGAVGDSIGEEGREIPYAAGHWHSIALVADGRNDRFVFFMDGRMFHLRSSFPTGIPRCSLGIGDNDVVAIGGKGGEWATLAISNLAIFGKAINDDDLGAITRVFVTWRRGRGIAVRAGAQGDDQGIQESPGARDEGIPTEDGTKTTTGAVSVASIEKRTVHGEALINRIVLPMTAAGGGELILKVADVSHSRGGRRGEAVQAAESNKDLGAFQPLPPVFVRLEKTD